MAPFNSKVTNLLVQAAELKSWLIPKKQHFLSKKPSIFKLQFAPDIQKAKLHSF
jgi:hypothetical protein